MNESPPEGASTNQSTDSQIIGAESVDGNPDDADHNLLSALTARLASRHGISLVALADGSLLATRWNLTRPLADLRAAQIFARQIAGPM